MPESPADASADRERLSIDGIHLVDRIADRPMLVFSIAPALMSPR
jgi:hypothetical protein